MTKHTPEMNNSNSFKQPEALRLAVILETRRMDDVADSKIDLAAADEIRRLYAEVDRLSYQVTYPDNFLKEPEQEPVAIADGTFNHNCPIGTPLYTFPQAREPLTDEQKTRMWQKEHEKESRRAAFDWYFQGIADSEAAHGIKGDA